MQEKLQLSDILSSATTEDALKIIYGFSAEDIIQQDSTGATILHHLCFFNEIEPVKFDRKIIIEKIIEKNPSILTLKWHDLDNPIQLAIKQDDVEAVQILASYYHIDTLVIQERQTIIDNNDEVIKEEVIFTPPLAFALRYGQFKVVKFLLENGFGHLQGLEDLSKYNLTNPTTEDLQEFYKDLLVTGHGQLLKELHRHLGYYEGHIGQNSKELIVALNERDQAKALELISQGHYIYDFSGFMYFRGRGKEILDLLFINNLHHPNYNWAVKDKNGNTPLNLAVIIGNTEAAKLLIEAAKGNSELLQTLFAGDNEGKTPLHRVVAGGGSRIEVVEVLIEAAKGNPELLQTLFAGDNEGKTPLHHVAAGASRIEVAEVLIEAAKGNPKLLQTLFAGDRHGYTPLHLAVQFYHEKVAKLLIEAAKGNPELLQTLLAANNHGSTSLQFALENGSTETAKVLIEAAKGNPELLQTLFADNGYGNAPLNLAVKGRYVETVNLLLAHGACPPLNMLLKNILSPEMNSMLIASFVRNHAYNAYSAGWNILEGAAKAFSGGITKFYDKQSQVDQKTQSVDASKANKKDESKLLS